MKAAISIFFSKHWDALIASLVASAFIYFFTHHSGIGISPDSVTYESTATNIRDHFSFTDFNGLPLVDFPLGYPCFLAFFSFITGLSVLQVTPILNCLLFSGVIILTSVILSGYQKTSSIYKACILALLACSPCLLEVYAMLWSETLFIFLILLFFVSIKWYIETYSATRLFFASLVIALAFVTRYAGVTVLATGLFLLFFNGGLPLRKKIAHLILLSVTGSSLVIINLIRNRLAAGHSTGVREKAIRTVNVVLEQIGTTVSDWLPFTRGHASWAGFIFLVVLVMGIIILIYHLLQQQYFPSFKTIVTCFFVVYALFMLIIASVSRFEDLSGRLLSPLYIPMLLTGSTWVISFMQRSFRVRRIFVGVVLLIVYAGFHYNHYQLNAEAWEGIKDSGMPGYAEGSWRNSPAVALVRKNKPFISAPVYANANDAVYFLTGIHATALPHKEIQQEVAAFLRQPSFFLIWFIDGDNPDLVSLDFIKQHKKMVSVQEAEGGAIYFFTDPAADASPK